ncbi:MAG: hypothetical protein AAFV33_11100, partial [Chloroflexota bacterium]
DIIRAEFTVVEGVLDTEISGQADIFGIEAPISLQSSDISSAFQVRKSSNGVNGNQAIITLTTNELNSVTISRLTVAGTGSSNPFPSDDCSQAATSTPIPTAAEIPDATATAEYTPPPTPTLADDGSIPLASETPTVQVQEQWCAFFDFAQDDHDEFWQTQIDQDSLPRSTYVVGEGWKGIQKDDYRIGVRVDFQTEPIITFIGATFTYAGELRNSRGASVSSTRLFESVLFNEGETFVFDQRSTVTGTDPFIQFGLVAGFASSPAPDATLINYRVEGVGFNPFGFSNCAPGGDLTPTPTPTITPTITATPTETQTPSATPTDIGEWCYQRDFTISQGGVTTNPASDFGVYVPGDGWFSEYEERNGTLGSYLFLLDDTPNNMSLNQVQADYVQGTSTFTFVSYGAVGGGIVTADQITITDPGLHTASYQVDSSVNDVRFVSQNTGVNAGFQLLALRYYGSGTNPFGVDNCTLNGVPTVTPIFTPLPTVTTVPIQGGGNGGSGGDGGSGDDGVGPPPTLPPPDGDGNGGGDGFDGNPLQGDGDGDGDGFNPGGFASGVGNFMEGVVGDAQAWGDLGETMGTGLSDTWNAAPPQSPPQMPDCVERPLDSNICAVYYILENTIFAGVGVIIIPIMVLILDIVMLFLAFSYVRTMTGWFEKEIE